MSSLLRVFIYLLLSFVGISGKRVRRQSISRRRSPSPPLSVSTFDVIGLSRENKEWLDRNTVFYSTCRYADFVRQVQIIRDVGIARVPDFGTHVLQQYYRKRWDYAYRTEGLTSRLGQFTVSGRAYMTSVAKIGGHQSNGSGPRVSTSSSLSRPVTQSQNTKRLTRSSLTDITNSTDIPNISSVNESHPEGGQALRSLKRSCLRSVESLTTNLRSRRRRVSFSESESSFQLPNDSDTESVDSMDEEISIATDHSEDTIFRSVPKSSCGRKVRERFPKRFRDGYAEKRLQNVYYFVLILVIIYFIICFLSLVHFLLWRIPTTKGY